MNTLLTGASRGLGREIARILAGKGHRLTLVARDEAGLTELAGQLQGTGHRVWAADLSRADSLHLLLERMRSETFDLLINNAGASRFGPFAGLSQELVEQLVCLNFTAPVLLSRAFLQSCKPGATLVNVTSIVATLPMPGNSLYSATKAGLSVLSECLHFEARDKGVRVLDFRPVTIKTDFHHAAGGISTKGADKGVSADEAARDLVGAIERGNAFVYAPGLTARVVALASRLLPRRLLVGRMCQRSVRAGYLPARG